MQQSIFQGLNEAVKGIKQNRTIPFLCAQSLHIIGGEPLLQWDLLSVILAEARQLGYRNIFIYTNLMDVGELNWEELSGASLVIHASSHNQDVTNRMIENRPDFSNFYENMNKLRKTGIPLWP